MKAAQNTIIEELRAQNLELQNANNLLQNSNRHLQEQIAWLQKQLFGKKSEKIVRDLDEECLYLPGMKEWFESQNSPQEEEIEEVEAHTRRKPKKRNGKDAISYPDDLPVEQIVIDVSEDKKLCPETGAPLEKIGQEISRKLAYKPGSFYVKEYIRPKYAQKGGVGIETADLPDGIIPKCRVDESFLAEILTKKFADHQPLYRISEALTRQRITISRQLLSQWVVRLGLGLKPLYDLMKTNILESENIFVDETPIEILAPGKGKTHQGYMWVMCGGKSKDPPNRIYAFRMNRKHENLPDLIGDYRGTLHSDKYGAYETLAGQGKITWCPCWSHIRRKFFEAESGDPQFRKWVLRKIRYLFMFERVAWRRSEEERVRIRLEKETPIIDEIIQAAKKKLYDGKLLPKSKFRTALGYLVSLIPYLKSYTLDPWARLDNNVAERAVRPLAIGRKNWLFVGSEEGGLAGAVILSLVQTCRALKINPQEYLEDILRRIMSHPNNQLSDLLPENWLNSRKS